MAGRRDDNTIKHATSSKNSANRPADVILRDESGDYVDASGGGGGGGGTEYTEDTAAAANPIGGAQILVRQDTPAGLVTTDGDNVARRGTDFGAAFSQILDSSGNFVDTFGGGTQYTEGDTDATITGTAAMMEVAANTLQPVQGTVTGGLLINLGANNDVTVAGVATAANQLADGHNVTVDNASGASAVNIQDGGNTITVDGTIAATQSGTWNINDISGTISLPTGAATAANQLADGHNVTIDNAAGAASVNIRDGGNSITVDGTITASPSVTGGGTEAAAQRVTIANNSTGVLSVDDNAGSLTVDQGTHDNLNLNANLQVANTDNSETNPALAAAAVSASVTPTNIVTTYNNTTTTATSAEITRDTGCLYADVVIELSKANSPTSIEFFIEAVDTDDHPYAVGWQQKWIYDDAVVASGLHESVTVKLPATSTFKVRVVAVGTDASNTFTVVRFNMYQHSGC